MMISWQEVDDYCRELAEKVTALPQYAREIIAVSRGGLIPATMLSYELGMPIVDLVEVQSPQLYSLRDDLLIVDDICDTGSSFMELHKCFPNALYSAILVKPQGKPLCDYWVREVLQDTWVVFPWALHDPVNR